MPTIDSLVLIRAAVITAIVGLIGTVMPEEYGGSDVGFLSTVIIIEELARG